MLHHFYPKKNKATSLNFYWVRKLCQPQVITLTLPTKFAWIFNVVRAGMEEVAGFLGNRYVHIIICSRRRRRSREEEEEDDVVCPDAVSSALLACMLGDLLFLCSIVRMITLITAAHSTLGTTVKLHLRGTPFKRCLSVMTQLWMMNFN
jgi:hypothetical protein